MTTVAPTKRWTEYKVHRGEEWGDDVDHYDGKEWRQIRKLVEECEQGMHPDIHEVEKVKRSDAYGESEEYETLYAKEIPKR